MGNDRESQGELPRGTGRRETTAPRRHRLVPTGRRSAEEEQEGRDPGGLTHRGSGADPGRQAARQDPSRSPGQELAVVQEGGDVNERRQALAVPESAYGGAKLRNGRRSGLSTVTPVQRPHFAIDPSQRFDLSVGLRAVRQCSRGLGRRPVLSGLGIRLSCTVVQNAPGCSDARFHPVGKGRRGARRIHVRDPRCIGRHQIPPGRRISHAHHAWQDQEI